ncbi:GNAT family N-acetyltransferase [Microlunatus soli]|uniref:GNAT family N-acetyltransferase n=1 Tax=Microlunatus soli TaxID=630515 RepID=UPI0018D3BA7B|nr:GNAT family protein [Microlunatus soli]
MTTDRLQVWRFEPSDVDNLTTLYADPAVMLYEAAGAALRSAFDDHGAACVVATTMAVNRRSRGILETLGFRHTRTVHLDWESPLPGAESGEVIYERERDVNSTSTAHRQDHPAIRPAEQDHEHR